MVTHLRETCHVKQPLTDQKYARGNRQFILGADHKQEGAQEDGGGGVEGQEGGPRNLAPAP